jgi:RimJ/RimL family protein N-acetyltransferase
MSQPRIFPTERPGVELRELTEADDPIYNESYNASRPEIAAFDPDAAEKHITLADTRNARLNAAGKLRLGIWDQDTFVGSANVTPEDNGQVEIGYWTDSRQTGHGYATLAAQALASRFPTAHADVVEGNTASAHVLENAGFTQTARRSGKLIFEVLSATESAEKSELNPLTHPFGYFDAQVQFAQKWAHISGEDFATVLLEKTALHRRIFMQARPQNGDTHEWSALLAGLNKDTDSETVSSALYEAYASKPYSKYDATPRRSALGYDYQPDSKTVKIHFTNPERGKNPFSEENLALRRQEFRHLLEEVSERHPDAQLLMSASWLRSTKSYRSLSPPNIAEQQDLMSTTMSFSGDSVWGQFIDRNGNLNQRVYDQFVTSLQKAETIDELLGAFPYKTIMAKDPIDKYFQYYGVGKDATSPE